MKVRFAIDVLQDEKAWQILDRIVDYFLEQRHLWDVEEPAIIDASRWIQDDRCGRAGKNNLQALQKCYTDAIYQPQKNPLYNGFGGGPYRACSEPLIRRFSSHRSEYRNPFNLSAGLANP